MKKSYLFAAVLAAGMSFASCSNDEVVENVATQSTLGVEKVGLQGLNSRAGITATSFTNGESLSLFIYQGNKAAGFNTAYNDGGNTSDQNVEYTLGAEGWTPKTLPIVLSSKIGTVYAAYTGAWSDTNVDPSAIAITVAANQESGQSDGSKDANGQVDYMWADPVENVSNASKVVASDSKSGSKVDLKMNHALAMITFKFQNSSENASKYPGVGNVTSIKLYNSDTSTKAPIRSGAAKLNIATGAIAGAEPAADGITITPTAQPLMDETGADKLARMLVYPSANFTAGEAKMEFVVDDVKYTLNVPALADQTDATKGYVAGNNYIYTLTMKGTALEISSVSIKEWKDVPAGEGDIENPDAQ